MDTSILVLCDCVFSFLVQKFLDQMAEQTFQHIQIAHDILGDPVKRKVFDEHGWLGVRMLHSALNNNPSTALSLTLKRPDAIRREINDKLQAELKRDIDFYSTSTDDIGVAIDATRTLLSLSKRLVTRRVAAKKRRSAAPNPDRESPFIESTTITPAASDRKSSAPKTSSVSNTSRSSNSNSDGLLEPAAQFHVKDPEPPNSAAAQSSVSTSSSSESDSSSESAPSSRKTSRPVSPSSKSAQRPLLNACTLSHTSRFRLSDKDWIHIGMIRLFSVVSS